MAPLQPDIVILQVGINDLKTLPLFPERQEEIIANCKTNIQQIVDKSLQADASVILTTIFPLGQLPIERRLFWSEEVALAIDDVNQFCTHSKVIVYVFLTQPQFWHNERHNCRSKL